MEIKVYVNSLFTSNMYLLSTAKSNRVWLVDLGALDKVLEQLEPQQEIAGVLLTHYHYDHIYGINQLQTQFSDCKIYGSEHTIQGLYDPKMNLSFYHEDPIIYQGKNGIAIYESTLDTGEFSIKIIATPGHNPGHLAFLIQNHLFTGDAYIPHIDVVTKLKGGNKSQSLQSLITLKSLINPNIILCPGHGPMMPYQDFISHLDGLIDGKG